MMSKFIPFIFFFYLHTPCPQAYNPHKPTMKYIHQLATHVANHMALIILAVAALSLTFPHAFLWAGTGAVTPMLGIVMFGMGLTLRASDFKPVLTHPHHILVGELAQFIIMPATAWILCHLLHLPQQLALGVILVGCCPGGTASNVICYLAKGDVALSVAMTGVSTLLAPILTPALVLLLAGQAVHVDLAAMFTSITQVVILPILLGIIVNHYFRPLCQKITPLLPMVSTLAIAAIITIIISHNAANIITCSHLVALAVILHNLIGLTLGYAVARTLRLPPSQRTAISIEVGMQNSGLATSLATTHFAIYPMAAIPGAIFSVWHNLSGSLAAHILKKQQPTHHTP